MGKLDFNAMRRNMEAKEIDTEDESPLKDAYALVWGTNRQDISQIEISKIVPYTDENGKTQPFKINTERVEQIKLSASDIGIITPLIVRKVNGMYQIISGHHRYHAAKELDMLTLPCVVKDISDDDAIRYVVESNIQRMKLTPSEYGQIFLRYIESKKELSMSVSNIAEKFGISKKNMYRYINIVKLDETLQECFDNDLINLDCSDVFVRFSINNQRSAGEFIRKSNRHISLSQAVAMEKIATAGDIECDAFLDAFKHKEKPVYKNKVYNQLEKSYKISKNYTEKQLDELTVKLLEEYFKGNKEKK